LFTAVGGVVAVSNSSLDPDVAGNSLSLIGFNVPRLIYVSFAFGFSYMVNIWVFFHVSEGLFNPAVSALKQLNSLCLRYVRSHWRY